MPRPQSPSRLALAEAPGARDPFRGARLGMVAGTLAARGVRDRALLDAMAGIPRERFVPEAYAEEAYEDRPLPIGFGQTISQPYVVARMIEAAGVGPRDRVLEVGAGSGYAAAVLSRLCREVVAVERRPELACEAADRLARLGIGNVRVVVGDGSLGRPDLAPFDAVLVSAAAPRPPEALLRQLRPGGRLIAPIGGRISQRLCRIEAGGDGDPVEEDLGAVRFVPLLGAEGWRAPRVRGRS